VFENIEVLSTVFVVLAAAGVVVLSYVKLHSFIGLERVLLGFSVLICKDFLLTEYTFIISCLGYLFFTLGVFKIHNNLRGLKERGYIDPVTKAYNRSFLIN